MPPRLLVAVAVLALTALGYVGLPGHTYLQSDTQIYAPILEHQHDPRYFTADLLAQRPHVAFTLYDEAALWLRRLTGLPLQAVLQGQQFLYRAAGVLGVVLLATSAGLTVPCAVVVASLYALGATVDGPAVLTVEYEPVPRGFAVPLLLLSFGLLAHGRGWLAGIPFALALLYHPPTLAAPLTAFAVLLLWPVTRPLVRQALPAFAIGALVLAVFVFLQTDTSEPQLFLARIPLDQAELQRLRARYNWISLWPGHWVPHYLAVGMIAIAALWLLRRQWPVVITGLFAVLCATGLLAMPLSWLLLEQANWSLVPQLQPARALLWVVVAAVVGSSVLAIRAAQAGRWWQAALWLFPVYALPVNVRLLQLLFESGSDPVIARRLLLTITLAVLTALALCVAARIPRVAPVLLALVMIAPALIIPALGGIRNYPPLHTAELDDVAAWARTNTPLDAVFLFPNSQRDLSPGVFRARALRAIYVDWKAGGQVNFLRELGQVWWERWQQTMDGIHPPARYADMGVDYVVTSADKTLSPELPLYRNSRYAVYGTGRHARR